MEHLVHFGLVRDPFRNDPQRRFYFDSRQHSDAERRLMRGVHQRKGLAVLTGQVGSGKTTLIRHLLDRLDDARFEAGLLVLIQGAVDTDWLLRRVAEQIGIDAPAARRAELLGQIYARLVEIHQQGRRAVILIDEAQMLDRREILIELRGLLNLEFDEQRLLSLILTGLPELGGALALDEPLADRIEIRVELSGLDAASAGEYLAHRIRQAGGDPAILGRETAAAVARLAGGVPRRMNTLADNALFEAYLAGRRATLPEDVERAARDLGWAPAAAAVPQAEVAPEAPPPSPPAPEPAPPPASVAELGPAAPVAAIEPVPPTPPVAAPEPTPPAAALEPQPPGPPVTEFEPTPPSPPVAEFEPTAPNPAAETPAPESAHPVAAPPDPDLPVPVSSTPPAAPKSVPVAHEPTPLEPGLGLPLEPKRSSTSDWGRGPERPRTSEGALPPASPVPVDPIGSPPPELIEGPGLADEETTEPEITLRDAIPEGAELDDAPDVLFSAPESLGDAVAAALEESATLPEDEETQDSLEPAGDSTDPMASTSPEPEGEGDPEGDSDLDEIFVSLVKDS